jgi:hypothetical protein
MPLDDIFAELVSYDDGRKSLSVLDGRLLSITAKKVQSQMEGKDRKEVYCQHKFQ